MTTRRFCLEVRGELACFTRPEMKVERVSYDVITPSAARAVFDAIFWKPALRWKVGRIEVLAPIRWTNLRRNEVASKIGLSNLTPNFLPQSLINGRSVSLVLQHKKELGQLIFVRNVRQRGTRRLNANTH